mgnify:CR=1 FL=1
MQRYITPLQTQPLRRTCHIDTHMLLIPLITYMNMATIKAALCLHSQHSLYTSLHTTELILIDRHHHGSRRKMYRCLCRSEQVYLRLRYHQ